MQKVHLNIHCLSPLSHFSLLSHRTPDRAVDMDVQARGVCSSNVVQRVKKSALSSATETSQAKLLTCDKTPVQELPSRPQFSLIRALSDPVVLHNMTPYTQPKALRPALKRRR